jgi:hypothetical protein
VVHCAPHYFSKTKTFSERNILIVGVHILRCLLSSRHRLLSGSMLDYSLVHRDVTEAKSKVIRSAGAAEKFECPAQI